MRYLWYRFKYNFGKHLPLKVPVDLSLELASTCNMRCTYCYHNDQANLPFKAGLMPSWMAYQAIQEAGLMGVPSIKFNYRGESTMHPDYHKITALAKDISEGTGAFIERMANSNFKFDTNNENIFKGLSNLTKVKISYDSFRKNVFEKQRYKGDHDLTTANIEKFYNHPLRIKSNTAIVIQAVRTSLNKNEDFEAEIKKRWPSAELSVRDVVAGRKNDTIKSLEIKTRDFENRIPCKQAFVRIILDQQGLAHPCCPSIKNDLIIGSIKEKSLYEIFNSEIAKQLRTDLKSGKAFDKDPCKTCSSFESYKGFKPTWGS